MLGKEQPRLQNDLDRGTRVVARLAQGGRQRLEQGVGRRRRLANEVAEQLAGQEARTAVHLDLIEWRHDVHRAASQRLAAFDVDRFSDNANFQSAFNRLLRWLGLQLNQHVSI